MIQLNQIYKAILKYKTSSGLTLLSLVISFLGIIILTLYVLFEKSFDRYNENANSVYRIETKLYGDAIPAVMGGLIQQKVPEAEKLTVFWFSSGKTTTVKLKETNTAFYSNVLYAGESVFDLFTLPLISGSKETSLTEPNTVVLTESLATKLFGTANPLGENIFQNGEAFKVTAVMKDFPKNSSFSANCILSFATKLKDKRDAAYNWSEWSYNIFIRLKSGSNPVQVADKIERIPEIAESLKDMKENNSNQPYLILRPLPDIHFVVSGIYIYSNPLILNVLTLLAIVLAVMGAVNFINFSTSQAPLRSKALSILQVLGGSRISSMGQIIAESVLLSLFALCISLAIHQLCYSAIETFFGISGLSFAGRYQYILWFFIFAFGFGILAGLYPARYITSSPIVLSVKGKSNFSGKGKFFRNTLVTIQFVFTIALLISAFIIEKQLNFWRNFDIGVNKENVVYLKTTWELEKHNQAFADELMKNHEIVDYTYAQFIPGKVGMGWGREIDGQNIQLTCWPVDDKFLDFFGIRMAEGRKFLKGSTADINSFILNKKAVEKFGWNNPLERKMPGFDFTGPIIGVAENFNFSSLKEEIEPMQFWLTDVNARKSVLLLRLKSGNYTETNGFIKNQALKFDPRNPVEINFLDDTLNALYEKEERMSRLIEFVAMWCMLLAITGLMGLIIFICRDRVKEIGIRKVNGATIAEVMKMLNRDIIRWVVVAFVLAVPVAWYAMHRWLENFAYKTELSWWIFAIAGLMALGIALLTVSWQSWKAATRNPVEALRYE